MINFSTLKWLTIPDGKVKQIIDGNGTVLWRIKLSSIAVTTPPTKTQYQEGEVFDPTGMVVTATYSNGETKVISNYTVLNGDKIAEDMTTITISYTEDGVTATTVYEVGFDDGMRTITITDTNSSYNSSTHSQYAYITHNGVDYIDPTTFNAKIGDVIRCTVGASGGGSAQIIVNGTHVVSKPVSGIFEQTTYEYEIVSDVTINLQRMAGSRGSTYGYITITET